MPKGLMVSDIEREPFDRPQTVCAKPVKKKKGETMKISRTNIHADGSNAVITRWKSPSSFTGAPELTQVTRITMTCGGGMGGAQWDEYVLRTARFPEGVTSYTRYDGKEIRLNSAYMVKAEDFTLVKATLDVRAWKKASGRHEDRHPDTETKHFLVEDGTKVLIGLD